jgi:hypothetical protein
MALVPSRLVFRFRSRARSARSAIPGCELIRWSVNRWRATVCRFVRVPAAPSRSARLPAVALVRPVRSHALFLAELASSTPPRDLHRSAFSVSSQRVALAQLLSTEQIPRLSPCSEPEPRVLARCQLVSKARQRQASRFPGDLARIRRSLPPRERLRCPAAPPARVLRPLVGRASRSCRDWTGLGDSPLPAPFELAAPGVPGRRSGVPSQMTGPG